MFQFVLEPAGNKPAKVLIVFVLVAFPEGRSVARGHVVTCPVKVMRARGGPWTVTVVVVGGRGNLRLP